MNREHWKREIDKLLGGVPTKPNYNRWLNVMVVASVVLILLLSIAMVANGGKITTAGAFLYERQAQGWE